MAHLAIVGSHSVNGVAALHTDILKRELFRDFYELWPERFNNKTNGITPRRWLKKANPGLSALITEAIGEEWVTDLDELRRLAPLAGDAAFAEKWRAVKRANKDRLVRIIADQYARRGTPLAVDPDAMFDCQVKRIHEYKRQLLNLLHVDHPLQPHQGRPPGRARAAGRDVRGQGRSRLPHGQAHHPSHQRGGRRGEPRSRHRGPAEGGLPGRLSRLPGRARSSPPPSSPSRSRPRAPKPPARGT